ncbi:probable chlorophyll(ide) b reductase NYC1, chloroplastic [Malania oleifera]|uniref:probable chlorophyll(ide) b reductase NYC1, chloroplastic n=1 Tax=Malania oleifera TaxID=397392 RepID=UPI0025AE325A|nr:probable chlorophyll(ide) b reductase NYC1, chloroplastic [Malania oleifera]
MPRVVLAIADEVASTCGLHAAPPLPPKISGQREISFHPIFIRNTLAFTQRKKHFRKSIKYSRLPITRKHFAVHEHSYSQSSTLPMATVVARLQISPPADHVSLRNRCGASRSLAFRRSSVCSQQCRSFRSEEGGETGESATKERKCGNQKENGLESRKGLGVLKFVKSAIFGVCNWRLRSEDEYRNDLAKLEEIFSTIAVQIGRYIVTMASTGVIVAIGFQLSGGDSQMNTLIWYSWLGGVIIGTMIGSNLVLEEHSRAGPRNVVVTGSTRGLGKALAREFLLSGDRVVVTSRCLESVELTIRELQENLKEGMRTAGGSSTTNLARAKVTGMACDVCKPEEVQKLANFAVNEFGSIDIWINNAGTNKGFRPLLQFTDEDINQIVSTNLVGSLLCTREAMCVMRNQNKVGHIFNMDGAGSGGSSTPLTAVYGSTKCGLRQLQASLLKECKKSRVGVHTASPGMVLTDLLLSGSTIKNKQMFNIICELPETVARTLVPRMRVVKGTGKAINYLTPPRILLALVTAWLRRGRWFDDQGRALYAAEADRIRNWAENRTRISFTDAMEMHMENNWMPIFSLSVVCAFIILSSTTGSTFPGT